MKTFALILKILAALAALAGIIYIIAVYGDKIVAFARRLLNRSYNCYSKDDSDCFDFENEIDAPIAEDLIDDDFEG